MGEESVYIDVDEFSAEVGFNCGGRRVVEWENDGFVPCLTTVMVL